jgi:hypothetical protein
MEAVIGWFARNYQWLFSGAGVVLVVALVAKLSQLLSRRAATPEFGDRSDSTTLPGPSDFASNDPPPNVMPDGEFTEVAHIDHTKDIHLGYGTRFDKQFRVAIATFRNELRQGRRVGDAFDVKAEVRFTATKDTKDVKLPAYWLESLPGETDGVRLEVGGASRSVVVAVRDHHDGSVFAVEDSSKSGYTFPPTLLLLAPPHPSDRKYPLSVLLARDGEIISHTRYVLQVTATEIRLTKT